MTTPAPNPTPGTNDKVAGAISNQFLQPTATSGGSTNLYGIDNTIAGAKVNIGGLFPAKDGATVLDAVTSFAHLSPAQIAVIQRRLWLGGYYGDSKTPPTLGVVGKDDLSAFKQAATVAAQTSTDLDQLLKSGAARGQYDGVAATIAAQLKAHEPNQVQKADPLAVASNIDAVFQKLTGRKATPGERAAYVTAFQAADLHVQQQNIEARNQALQTQQSAIDNAGGMDPNLAGALAPDTSQIPDPRKPTPGGAAGFRVGEQQTQGQYQRPDVSVDDFMRAIAGQESGGNPTERNKDSGAYGTFQIMPANWASWSREAGLGSNAPQTPGNQEIVARHKMQQYHDQFGSWEAAAAAWYGGPSAGQRYSRNPNDPLLTRKQGKYPSIASYVQQVNGRLNTGSPDHQPFEYSSPVTPSVDVPTPTYTTQAFNDQAFMEAKVRKDHPVETQAKDVANTYDSFLSIIGAR